MYLDVVYYLCCSLHYSSFEYYKLQVTNTNLPSANTTM